MQPFSTLGFASANLGLYRSHGRPARTEPTSDGFKWQQPYPLQNSQAGARWIQSSGSEQPHRGARANTRTAGLFCGPVCGGEVQDGHAGSARDRNATWSPSQRSRLTQPGLCILQHRIWSIRRGTLGAVNGHDQGAGVGDSPHFLRASDLLLSVAA
jgi:hypothetical protein